jgi:AraC-like DNA-binding protein
LRVPRPDAGPPPTHTLLAALARQIRDVVRHWNVAPEPLLARAGVSAADIAGPAARIELGPMLALIEAARQATREPALGWYAGAQSTISMFGFLGFATMSAPTVAAALELAVEYANPLLGTIFTFRIVDEGEKVALVLDETVDFGPSRDFILGSAIAATWQLGYRLVGARLRWRAELMMSEPPYFKRMMERIPPAIASAPGLEGLRRMVPPVRFAQRANRFVFARASLDLPLIMSDAAAHGMAVAHCEVEQHALATDRVAQVRHAIERDAQSSMESVARDLHVSPRTLRRQLLDRGFTFSNLATEVRRERAQRLLRTTELAVAEVATQVGYATITSFVRAFHGWTAMSPGAFRRAGRH